MFAACQVKEKCIEQQMDLCSVFIDLIKAFGVSESNLPEVQCSFCWGWSTIDMFAVSQVKEKCIEQQMDLCSVFIDLNKAFDAVNREALWSILTKVGCPHKFTTLVGLFHNNMTGQGLSDGD